MGQRIGLLALETVATEHHREEPVQRLGPQQVERERPGLVGQARHGQAARPELRQPLDHARVHGRELAVDLPIVLLVVLPGRPVQGVDVAGRADVGQPGDLGQGQLVGQHRADQMFRAHAHGALDQRPGDGGQVEFGQRPVERLLEVTERVDHRPVEIDDHCPHAPPLRGSQPPGGARFALGRPGGETQFNKVLHQASAARIWSITLL